jgi:hypothetical protein
MSKKTQKLWDKQRVERGWSDADWYSADHSLSKALAGMLRKYVADGHGVANRFCGDGDVPDIEKGIELQRAEYIKHAEVLERWLFEDEHRLLSYDDSQALFKEAKATWAWFATNFGTFWD